MKLKLCRNVHNISLNKIVFLSPLLMCFRRYGNLLQTYNGKSEVGLYFYLTADILTKVIEESSTKHMNFVQIAEFDWLPWQQKC